MSRRQPSPLWLPEESDLPPEHSWLRIIPWIVLALMTLAFAVGFSWLSLARHSAYQSHAFDLGNVDQAVWNTLKGHLLRFTDMPTTHHKVLTSRLGIHVEPILALLAILYVFHSGPETLLVVQAVIVACGAIPAYLLAKHWLQAEWLALAFPFAYLVHPSLQSAVLDDFHAVTLSACFLLWTIYFALKGSEIGFAISAVFAVSTKEEIGLLIAVLGLVFLFRRRIYSAFMSAVCGIGWFLLCVLVIIPSFNPSGQSPYVGRYRYLGHGLGGILIGLFRHPDLVGRALTSVPRVTFLNALLHPLGFAPLLAVPILLLALPSFAINMLSSDPRMYSSFYQYPAELIPYVVAAAIVGIAVVSRVGRTWVAWRSRLLTPVLVALVLVAAAIDTRRLGFSPLASGFVVPSAGPHQHLEDRILSQIPSTAGVAAADEIEPHLSDRFWIYLLPTVHPANGPLATYIVLDASIPSSPIRPSTLHSAVTTALKHGFGIVSARDGVLLLRKGFSQKKLPRSFFSFVFTQGSRITPEHVRWGPLELVGETIHPKSNQVNRARPAIAASTYWRTSKRLSAKTTISFYMSPIYTGPHPSFSSGWLRESESPTTLWFPLSRWPKDQTVRLDSLSLQPDVDQWGKVDIAIGVSGLGSPHPLASKTVSDAPQLIRVATVNVQIG